jgi:isopenicillin-N epimerase
VPAIGCDWYTGNAHKWLFAGKGCGFLWSDRARQDAIHPAVISNNFGTGYLNEFDWIGTRDPSAWLAVTDAIAFHRRLGSAALMARNHALAVDAATMLAARWGTVTGAPPSMLGATATIRVPEAVTARFDDAQHLHDRLVDAHGIELPAYDADGHYWLRISAQVYNEAEEYDRLAEAVEGLYH